MPHFYGWWDLEKTPPALVHRLTGQRIRFMGRTENDAALGIFATENQYWMRFEYRDPEVTYPLLVQWRNIPSKNGRPIVWRLDHLRSAALWRREGGADAPNPGYGLWRRVDDCVLDALGCWPKEFPFLRLPRKIVCEGGWLNGAWSSSFYRHVWHHAPPSPAMRAMHARLGLPPPSKEALHQPLIFALDAPPPAPWQWMPQAGSDPPAGPLDWGFEQSTDGTLILPETPATKPEGPGRQWSPSCALWRHLSSAFTDAWLLWEGASFALPSTGTNETHQVSTPAAGTMRLYGGPVAGADNHGSRVEVFRSLAQPINGRSNPFEFDFDDTNDGILRVSQPVHVLGWWDFDPEGPALVNSKSGQRVAFERVETDPEGIVERGIRDGFGSPAAIPADRPKGILPRVPDGHPVGFGSSALSGNLAQGDQ
jgi:hypothetical protein